MKVAGIAVVRLAAPAFDRLRQLFAVGAEVSRQRFEEGQPAGGIEDKDDLIADLEQALTA